MRGETGRYRRSPRTIALLQAQMRLDEVVAGSPPCDLPLVSVQAPEEVWAPVASQCAPRPAGSTPSAPRSRYALFTSVISRSPRADGVRRLAISTTVES